MAIDLQYDSTLDAIVIQATGRIVYEDLPPLAQKIIEHLDFRTNINQLFDCSDGYLDLSTKDLEQIARDFLSISEVLGLKRRLALLVSRDVDFGMMRQYEVYFRPSSGVEVHVFREPKEAMSWLHKGDGEINKEPVKKW